MGTETMFESQRGLQLSSIEWLLDHHRTKASQRRQMVDDMDLHEGESILDLGCGPGLWTAMFAEKVAPSGKVVGIDFSPELVEYGATILRSRGLDDSADFMLADFHSVPFADGSFDVVFIGNCCAYVSDIPALLEEHKRVAKRGGRVIAKEFDGGAVVFHPMDPHLLLKVQAASAQGLAANLSESYFDNYVGRKMHGNFTRAGFKDVSTTTYAIQKLSPLGPEAKRYMMGNGEWYGRLARPYLTENDAQRWDAAFDPNSEEYILDRDDFYFCMIETMTVGVR